MMIGSSIIYPELDLIITPFYPKGIPRPTMWHSYPVFESWARNQWPSQRLPLLDKLGRMDSTLSDWNKHFFGNIFRELDHLKRRIKGIQTETSYPSSNFLLSLGKDLQSQYSIKIRQLEVFWA